MTSRLLVEQHETISKNLVQPCSLQGVPKRQPNHRLLWHKDTRNGNLIIEVESLIRDDTEREYGIHRSLIKIHAASMANMILSRYPSELNVRSVVCIRSQQVRAIAKTLQENGYFSLADILECVWDRCGARCWFCNLCDL